ncbi:MAG: LCP family protein, partial [Anaerolineales bacterium]|nr:LCP family protein [Anaerolineales bacterium]
MRKWFVRLGLAAVALVLATAVFFYATSWASEPVAPGLAVLPTAIPTAERDFLTEIARQLEPLATQTVPATFTPIPTLTNTPPPDSTATPRPTRTPSSTPTPLATFTPTSVPQAQPQIAASIAATDTVTGERVTAVPTIDMPPGTTNILLLGTDSDPDGTTSPTHRTDTIIVVSINAEQKTASMLSLPRDLYVSIPGWTPNRINTVVARGEASN